ncbi:MAG TPA: hypothetical protein VLB73_01085 [Patescibacteria group bacterium]|nr:hypothetical protein [Patescibacteria group bacterium]
MKVAAGLLCLVGIIGLSLLLYHTALTQSTYDGLPTVPCIDYTKPILQDFHVTLAIQINDKTLQLDPTIGQDYGNCLHDIFTNDSSGVVYVQSNDNQTFSLGQFFDVWKKTFTPQQIFSFQTSSSRHIEVLVNNQKIEAYRNIILKPNQHIIVMYK